MIRLGTLLVCLISLLSCDHKDMYSLSSFTEDGQLRAVIEIPAGTNSKVEYDSQTHDFKIDQINRKDRVISYLSYPGNYGFIPSTLSNPTLGGDGDALDILVLSSSVPSGTVLDVIPVGVLKLIDNEEEDYKIIAIPAQKELQTIQTATFTQLQSQYKGVLEIIELWFLNYNPKDPARVLGWGNEKEALEMIHKNIVR